MTEAQWLTCIEPDSMLAYLGKNIGQRKLRLFGCACVRKIWYRLVAREGRRVVEVSEAFADGEATGAELKAAREAVPSSRGRWAVEAYQAARAVAGPATTAGVRRAAELVAQVSFWDGQTASTALRKTQAVLLRHLVGNPFQPVPALTVPSAASFDLAKVLYRGRKTAALPLCDALLEVGRDDLAEHFRQEQEHPKGCWALDLVLGKE